MDDHASLDKPQSAAGGSSPSTTAAIRGLSARNLHLVRLCWLDMTSTLRTRLIPTQRALAMLSAQDKSSDQPPREPELKLGAPTVALAFLQNGLMAADHGASPAGEWDLVADLTSLRLGPREGHAMVMCRFREKSGATVPLCPRTVLQSMEKSLYTSHPSGLSVVLGFEIEFVLLERKGPRQYERLSSDAHYWCTFGAIDAPGNVGTFLDEAVAQLARADVHVEVLHAEGGFGQFEMVLPPKPALAAIDTLVFARALLSNVATAHGYKMTLHPKPAPHGAGTAAHVHMSLVDRDGKQVNDSDIYEPFYAGILDHLRSILAFTCPSMSSYDRVKDSGWAGGTWVTWGRQNRETPLRKVDGSHWELRCMDGLANPYLALAVILASGTDGIISATTLSWKECTGDPATLSAAQRSELNILEQLPTSLEDALASLKRNDRLASSMLGQALVNRYIAIKRGEIALLESMTPDEQCQWILERY